MCRQFEAVLDVGAGLQLIVTSYEPVGAGPNIGELTEKWVRKVTEGFRSVDAKASITAVSGGTYGEAGYSGHCGGVQLSVDGKALRSVVCSVSASGADGRTHILLAALTGTEHGFQDAGVTTDEIISRVLDGWIPVPR